MKKVFTVNTESPSTARIREIEVAAAPGPNSWPSARFRTRRAAAKFIIESAYAAIRGYEREIARWKEVIAKFEKEK
jgi:hypothetical protein